MARNTSLEFASVQYRFATLSHPFSNNEFTHVFSMESLYYYSNMPAALREIHRVIAAGGLFVTAI